MTATVPPSMTPAPTSPDRSDRATFTARAIALDNWTKNNNVPETVAAMANVYANAVDTYNNALNVQADRILTQTAASVVTASNPIANAASAAASAASAQAFASTAQATNPDSPIRINPREITVSFTVPSNYNAASVGPITVSDGVTVTVSDNATWSVH